jgi:hypothetical protein
MFAICIPMALICTALDARGQLSAVSSQETCCRLLHVILTTSIARVGKHQGMQVTPGFLRAES